RGHPPRHGGHPGPERLGRRGPRPAPPPPPPPPPPPAPPPGPHPPGPNKRRGLGPAQTPPLPPAAPLHPPLRERPPAPARPTPPPPPPAHARVPVEHIVPDVVLLDLALPDGEPAAMIREIKQLCPTASVVAFSGTVTIELLDEILEAGAAGYLSKADEVG